MNRWRDSPLRVLLTLMLVTALAEVLVMLLLGRIGYIMPPVSAVFIDSLLLVLFLIPALYYLVASSLHRQIRERLETENALRSSKTRYRQLIDSIEGIVWEADPRTFAFTFVSKKSEDILGYPQLGWIESPTFWADHLHPDDREWAIDYCLSAIREQRDHVFEYRMLAADGRVVWLRDLVTLVVNDGEVTGLRGLMVDISEIKSTELALIASEGRYQFLADNLNEVVWELDENLCYAFVSASVSAMFAYNAKELIGKPFVYLLTDKSRAELLDAIGILVPADGVAAGKGVHFTLEMEFIKKGGSRFWGEMNATLFFCDDNRIRSMVGSTRDISDRKRAETEVLGANDLLHKTINSLIEAVIVVDTSTMEIKDLNPAAARMFAYSMDELLGAQFPLLHVSPETEARISGEMVDGFSARGSYNGKLSMKKKNGIVFPCELSASPIVFEDGSGRKLHVCVIRDISAQLLHEEQLARAYNMVADRNAFVESVITSMQSGIIVLGRDMCISMINPYAADICQSDPDQLLGRNFGSICPELHGHLLEADEKKPDEMIVSFCGKRFIIGFNYFHLTDSRNIPKGVVITFKDLTEIVRIRNEIRQKQRLSAMGEVVARVAHEMRNPLFGMTSAGQILNMELELSSDQQLLMDSLLNEARRLNNLVDELLATTREVRLSKRRVNLVKVVNDSMRLASGRASEKGVEIAPDEMSGEIFVHADPEKLEQVLLNLLQNGVDACGNGGRVLLSTTVDGMYVVISVADNGSGIAETDMDSIFDVFYTTKKNGTGLGLSISRNIIDAHDGEISAQNNEAGGATFVVRLPLFSEGA